MNREELIIWLDALKPGDTVAVFELGGGGSLLSVNTVERRTKSGRIVCDSGMVFTKNGTLFGSPGYRHRCVRPVQGDCSQSKGAGYSHAA